jgi:hypothetical protein
MKEANRVISRPKHSERKLERTGKQLGKEERNGLGLSQAELRKGRNEIDDGW